MGLRGCREFGSPVAMSTRHQGQLCIPMKWPSIRAFYLCLLTGPRGGCSLGRAHHRGWKQPISREVGRFLSLLGIMAVTACSCPQALREPPRPWDSDLGGLRQPRLSLCFPEPRAAASLQQVSSQPRAWCCPAWLSLASENTLTALDMSCASLCLSCAPTLGQLHLVCAGGIRQRVPETASPCGLARDSLGKLWGPGSPFLLVCLRTRSLGLGCQAGVLPCPFPTSSLLEARLAGSIHLGGRNLLVNACRCSSNPGWRFVPIDE